MSKCNFTQKTIFLFPNIFHLYPKIFRHFKISKCHIVKINLASKIFKKVKNSKRQKWQKIICGLGLGLG
jgi:hypothetical protein